MKIKTSELTGPALDWAVAKAEGLAVSDRATKWRNEHCPHRYSTDLELAHPIIQREEIKAVEGNPLYFPQGNEKGDYYEPLWIAGKMHGQTQLIAAMRCYVASKLGDTVDIPEELL